MGEYKPGTVAVATVRGVKGVRVFRCATSTTPWSSAERVDGCISHTERHVTDVCPLVVLDLDGHDFAVNIDDIREALNEYDVRLAPGTALSMFEAIADQIEAQTKPPRIPEPGIGHFVNARKPDRTHANFVRVTERSWVELGNGGGWDWDDLIDPVEVEGGGA